MSPKTGEKTTSTKTMKIALRCCSKRKNRPNCPLGRWNFLDRRPRNAEPVAGRCCAVAERMRYALPELREFVAA
jgi:hypothetical protein